MSKYVVVKYSEKYKLPVGTTIEDDVETSILRYPNGKKDWTGSYPYRDKHKEPELFRKINEDNNSTKKI